MFSLDMTGEDTTKTGGTFLIEKQADPSAVWPRPSDPHTEWGASKVQAESLKGSLLNDLHLAVAMRRAKDTKWVVRTNPYEGGSDHTAFADAGVPSLLNWHFTDRYYHTNLDRPDKTSPAEMTNVGVAVATSCVVARLGRRAATRKRRANCWRRRPTRASRSSRSRVPARRGCRRGSAAAQATETAVVAAWRSGTTRRSTASGDCRPRVPSAGLDARIRRRRRS